jgi:hypothetical protein
MDTNGTTDYGQLGIKNITGKSVKGTWVTTSADQTGWQTYVRDYGVNRPLKTIEDYNLYQRYVADAKSKGQVPGGYLEEKDWIKDKPPTFSTSQIATVIDGTGSIADGLKGHKVGDSITLTSGRSSMFSPAGYSYTIPAGTYTIVDASDSRLTGLPVGLNPVLTWLYDDTTKKFIPYQMKTDGLNYKQQEAAKSYVYTQIPAGGLTIGGA